MEAQVEQIKDHAHQRILILDFGSQVTKLIARRVRENNVYCEIWPYDADEERIEAFQPKGIILSGGPASVTEDNSPRAPQKVFEMGIPVLGICYGQQLMCEQLGGKVEGSDHHEFGRFRITRRHRGHTVRKRCNRRFLAADRPDGG